jgi:hypothetical protein
VLLDDGKFLGTEQVDGFEADFFAGDAKFFKADLFVFVAPEAGGVINAAFEVRAGGSVRGAEAMGERSGGGGNGGAGDAGNGGTAGKGIIHIGCSIFTAPARIWRRVLMEIK